MTKKITLTPLCPLFDDSNIPYCICIATDRGCDIHLALCYEDCYKYMQIKKAMVNEIKDAIVEDE